LIRNLIWDVDGTLFDTYPAMAAAMQATLANLGADVPTDRLETLARVSMDHCIETVSEAHRLGAGDPERFQVALCQHLVGDNHRFPACQVCEAILTTGRKNVS
jgi:phosphoglycolate phosphatase-like HAD superfamily hydrolase